MKNANVNAVTTADEGGPGDTSAKRRSKRRKKKRKSKNGRTTPQGRRNPRLTAALTDIAGDEMWVDLQDSGLQDDAANLLAEALQSSSSVTMMNLSGNMITDGGAQAIADVVTAGGLPNLISMDLRGNDLSEEGIQELEGALSCRRNLDVQLGPLPSKEPVALTETPQEERMANGQMASSTDWDDDGSKAGKMSTPDPDWDQQVDKHEAQGEWASSSSGGLQFSNALGRKLIVLTNEDLRKRIALGPANQGLSDNWQRIESGVDSVPDGECNKNSWRKSRRFFRRDPHEWTFSHNDEESMLNPSGEAAFASELWLNVVELLDKDEPSPTALSQALCDIGRQLEAEVEALPAPLGDMEIDAIKPHMSCAIEQLGVLASILDLEPSQVTFQNGSSPQPAVGTHRLAAAEIVSLLLSAHSSTVNDSVAISKLVIKIMGLAVMCSHCNAVQCTALRVLQSVVDSRAEGVLRTLLDTVENVGKHDPCRIVKEKPLHQHISRAGTDCAGVPVGKRECHVGCMVAFAKVLAQKSTGLQPEVRSNSAEASSLWPVLQEILEGDDEWKSFVSVGGPLSTFLKEQEGELCPPRASYFKPSEFMMESTGAAMYDDWNASSSI